MRFFVALVFVTCAFSAVAGQDGIITIKLSAGGKKVPSQEYAGILCRVTNVTPIKSERSQVIIAHDITFARADGQDFPPVNGQAVHTCTFTFKLEKKKYWGAQGAERMYDIKDIQTGHFFALSLGAENCLCLMVKPDAFKATTPRK